MNRILLVAAAIALFVVPASAIAAGDGETTGDVLAELAGQAGL